MEYCCHVWARASSCYLELLDKLQKQICRTIGPSFAASLEPLAHCQIAASLSLSCRYYFGTCSSEPICLIFLSKVCLLSTVSFLTHSEIWNFLPIECFPLTYNLNGSKSAINRHLLSVDSF